MAPRTPLLPATLFSDAAALATRSGLPERLLAGYLRLLVQTSAVRVAGTPPPAECSELFLVLPARRAVGALPHLLRLGAELEVPHATVAAACERVGLRVVPTGAPPTPGVLRAVPESPDLVARAAAAGWALVPLAAAPRRRLAPPGPGAPVLPVPGSEIACVYGAAVVVPADADFERRVQAEGALRASLEAASAAADAHAAAAS